MRRCRTLKLLTTLALLMVLVVACHRDEGPTPPSNPTTSPVTQVTPTEAPYETDVTDTRSLETDPSTLNASGRSEEERPDGYPLYASAEEGMDLSYLTDYEPDTFINGDYPGVTVAYLEVVDVASDDGGKRVRAQILADSETIFQAGDEVTFSEVASIEDFAPDYKVGDRFVTAVNGYTKGDETLQIQHMFFYYVTDDDTVLPVNEATELVHPSRDDVHVFLASMPQKQLPEGVLDATTLRELRGKKNLSMTSGEAPLVDGMIPPLGEMIHIGDATFVHAKVIGETVFEEELMELENAPGETVDISRFSLPVEVISDTEGMFAAGEKILMTINRFYMDGVPSFELNDELITLVNQHETDGDISYAYTTMPLYYVVDNVALSVNPETEALQASGLYVEDLMAVFPRRDTTE